jgi:peptide chain release factor 2
MREISNLNSEISDWNNLRSDIDNLFEFIELCINDHQDFTEDLIVDFVKIQNRVSELEFELVFAGEYDQSNAILNISAGAGGSDSQDWAQMLMRMYLRWAEDRKFSTKILDLSSGEEAGVKSTTIEISGKNAYGWLKFEQGVHRLVRISPFDTDHQRHTSFALAEILPELSDSYDLDIKNDDLRIDTFRASGNGGQNVQKVESAVRITHLPSGLVATCQNERSQVQNHASAMKVLRARLLNFQMQKQAQKLASIKGSFVSPEWGNQIRSYILHPYKLVKDHRTGYESHDPQNILDGNLDSILHKSLVDNLGDVS